MKKVQVSVLVDAELQRKLKVVAQSEQRSVSGLLRFLARQEVERFEGETKP